MASPFFRVFSHRIFAGALVPILSPTRKTEGALSSLPYVSSNSTIITVCAPWGQGVEEFFLPTEEVFELIFELFDVCRSCPAVIGAAVTNRSAWPWRSACRDFTFNSRDRPRRKHGVLCGVAPLRGNTLARRRSSTRRRPSHTAFAQPGHPRTFETMDTGDAAGALPHRLRTKRA